MTSRSLRSRVGRLFSVALSFGIWACSSTATPGLGDERERPTCTDAGCAPGASCSNCSEGCDACSPSPPPPTCGDGACDHGETSSSCEEDCGDWSASSESCGDGICNENDSCSNCQADCGPCTMADSTLKSVFAYPNGFSGRSDDFAVVAAAGFKDSEMQVINGQFEHSAGAVWYKQKQSVRSFTTDFTFRLANTGVIPTIVAMTFCIQNSDPSTNDEWSGLRGGANTANLAGYGAFLELGQKALGNSVAIKFDISAQYATNYPQGGSPSTTALLINGGPSSMMLPENDLSPYGINLNLGHIMAAGVDYDGRRLTLNLRDTVTGAHTRMNWLVDIPAIVKGESAWVGFTAGEITPAANSVISWSFSQGVPSRLTTPTFSIADGWYATPRTVAISGPAGAAIHYTTDGQPPTSSSKLYTGPVSVTSSQIIQAIAVQPGYEDSLVAVRNYRIAPARGPILDFSRGFVGASGLLTINGAAKLSGPALQLTSDLIETASAWSSVPVNIKKFATTFTLRITPSISAGGITFAIQNQPTKPVGDSLFYVSGGPNALGRNHGGLGYAGTDAIGRVNGIMNSVAVKFDPTGGGGSTTGVYANAADPSLGGVSTTTSGIDLNSGNPLIVSIDYDGTAIKLSITDTVNKTTFSQDWNIDIPSAVGSNWAFVGFTASSGYHTLIQQVSDWTYTN